MVCSCQQSNLFFLPVFLSFFCLNQPEPLSFLFSLFLRQFLLSFFNNVLLLGFHFVKGNQPNGGALKWGK